jgi:hypothetical protein
MHKNARTRTLINLDVADGDVSLGTVELGHVPAVVGRNDAKHIAALKREIAGLQDQYARMEGLEGGFKKSLSPRLHMLATVYVYESLAG